MDLLRLFFRTLFGDFGCTNLHEMRVSSDVEFAVTDGGRGLGGFPQFILSEDFEVGIIPDDRADTRVFKEVNPIRHGDWRTVDRAQFSSGVECLPGARFKAGVDATVIDDVQIISNQDR